MNPAARTLACLAALGLSLSLTVAAAQTTQHGIRVADIDSSVTPGDDFFHYADGNGIKREFIPADRTSVGVFATLADQSSRNVAAIIAEASHANAAPGTPQRRIADLYASYMDEAAIEARGLKPIQSRLAAIAAIHTQRELARAFGETLRADVDALNNTNFHTPNLFGLWVAPSFNDPAHYAPYLMEGGLTLPNREFYLGDSPRMQSIRTAYQAHIAAILTLAGFTDADARAARILALERAIAEKHQSLADNEDIHKANNTWTLADFTAKAPGLDWPEYFRAAGLASQKSFIVWQPAGFTGEAALVTATPIDTWKDLLAYHVLEQYSGALPKAFADERFNFFGKTLSGVSAQRPREQRAIALVNAQLGDEVGQVYAQRYFSPEAKAKVQALVANLIAAFRLRIDNLTWMDPSTKAEAQQKLTTLIVSVGYPDTWRSYTGYDPKPDDLFGNVSRGSDFDYHYELARLGAPVNRHEWCMEPQTVNAVNMPLHNALNFPAAILQPPFFDPQAPDAANYGAIGAIIGHEISHTFDSEGSAFDAEGRVRNWWTPSDFAHFEASTARLAAQYNQYKPFPDLALNGRQTIDENTADVAGLNAAYDGFHASLHGQAAPVVDGFSGDQQFFIAFAQNYESKSREAALRQQVMTDPHSPSQFRADTVRNLDAWYPAFNVKPGETLYLAPDQRVKIW
jgi:endothelin-converting enzyme/putative endopeptidase